MPVVDRDLSVRVGGDDGSRGVDGELKQPETTLAPANTALRVSRATAIAGRATTVAIALPQNGQAASSAAT